VFSTYADVLRIHGAWRFSLAGFVMRMPMSLVGIATILSVKAEYGNYSLAGAVSAVNILVSCLCAPQLARLVDTRGQRAVMAPAILVSALSMAGLAAAILAYAPAWVLYLLAATCGATWGSPGSLVRSRWAQVVDTPQRLSTAYAMEAAIDEFCFIIGPILATVLGTAIHPVAGLVLGAVFFVAGGAVFFAQTSTEPPASPREQGERRPTVLRNPVVVILALTYVGAGTMFGANDVSVVAFTQEHGAPGLAGILLAFFAAGSFTAALFYGSRTWSQPLWKLFAGGILLLAMGVSTFLLARNLVMLGVVMWITGLTIAPTMTNVNTIVARVVPPVQLTEGLTWTITAMNVGTSVGSALGGRSIDASGAHGGFLVVVASAWVMVALMVIGLPRLRRDTTGPAAAPRVPDGEASRPAS
jgi:MFS family permease